MQSRARITRGPKSLVLLTAVCWLSSSSLHTLLILLTHATRSCSPSVRPLFQPRCPSQALFGAPCETPICISLIHSRAYGTYSLTQEFHCYGGDLRVQSSEFLSSSAGADAGASEGAGAGTGASAGTGAGSGSLVVTSPGGCGSNSTAMHVGSAARAVAGPAVPSPSASSSRLRRTSCRLLHSVRG